MFTSINLINTNCLSLVLKHDISDHYPCISSLNFSAKRTEAPKYILTKHLNKSNITKIKNLLSNEDWSFIENCDCNEAFDKFHTKLISTIDKIAPERYIRINKRRIKTEWMTQGISISSKKLLKLYRKIKSEEDLAKYKLFKKILVSTKRKAKTSFYMSKINDFKNDSRKMWCLLNKIIGKSNDKTVNIEKLEVGNLTTLISMI